MLGLTATWSWGHEAAAALLLLGYWSRHLPSHMGAPTAAVTAGPSVALALFKSASRGGTFPAAQLHLQMQKKDGFLPLPTCSNQPFPCIGFPCRKRQELFNPMGYPTGISMATAACIALSASPPLSARKLKSKNCKPDPGLGNRGSLGAVGALPQAPSPKVSTAPGPTLHSPGTG